MQIRNAARMLVVIAAVLPAACTTGPRRPTSAPDSAIPGVLALTATDFVDTDGNKYRDTSTIVIYIFPESAQYLLPMKAEGTFEFVLEDRSARPLARWNIGPDRAGAARRRLPPGPGYVFEISLLEFGSDLVDLPEAELVATFIPDDGSRSLHARTQSPLLLGSVGRSGGVP